MSRCILVPPQVVLGIVAVSLLPLAWEMWAAKREAADVEAKHASGGSAAGAQ